MQTYCDEICIGYSDPVCKSYVTASKKHFCILQWALIKVQKNDTLYIHQHISRTSTWWTGGVMFFPILFRSIYHKAMHFELATQKQ